ncbi:hypothetical protein CEXT_690371 [Caerostris extrusa]|uniref:Uncharacterized protein n=1 Tax=Caerostris extrusa TaxID=172846 RepID=A0AAV4XLP6_CAEEX|nr:hypothetical protein CEXT_690371 [Caerostris extrusa]
MFSGPNENIPSIRKPLENKKNLSTRQQASHHSGHESLETTSPDIRIESSALTSPFEVICAKMGTITRYIYVPLSILEHSVHYENPRELEESQYKATGNNHSIHESLLTTSPDIRIESSALTSPFEVICAKMGTITRYIYVPLSVLRSLVPGITGF